MPTHKSNWKRLRQDKLRRLRAKSNKSRIRTYIKTLVVETEKGTLQGETLEKRAKEAIRLIDQAAGRSIIHPNNAARKKSRIARLLNRVAKA